VREPPKADGESAPTHERIEDSGGRAEYVEPDGSDPEGRKNAVSHGIRSLEGYLTANVALRPLAWAFPTKRRPDVPVNPFYVAIENRVTRRRAREGIPAPAGSGARVRRGAPGEVSGPAGRPGARPMVAAWHHVTTSVDQ